MSRSIFTPEELAELAAFDAEIEDEDKPLTLEEWRESMRRDRGLQGPPKPHSEAQRAREREHSRKRRKIPAVAERQRQAHRAWYDKNHDYALAWQREYDRSHAESKRESILRLREELRGTPAAAEMLRLRKALGLTQQQLGAALGKSRAVVCNWEKGVSRIPARALEQLRAMAETEAGRESPHPALRATFPLGEGRGCR